MPAQQNVPPEGPMRAAPTFYLTRRQPLRPEVILLAIVVASGVLFGIRFAMGHGHVRELAKYTNSARSAGAASGAGDEDDDKDDPSQIDTIVLGDPNDAPVPARPGNHVSPVHPTILIILPRSGDQVGLIPDSAAGRLLYAWLAAFNQASYPALVSALPTDMPASAAAAQIQLRQQTGGFNLVSAKEVAPGILVFRLRDQTPAGIEALGTLQVRPNTTPPGIASFSLRAVPAAHEPASTQSGPNPQASPQAPQ